MSTVMKQESASAPTIEMRIAELTNRQAEVIKLHTTIRTILRNPSQVSQETLTMVDMELAKHKTLRTDADIYWAEARNIELTSSTKKEEQIASSKRYKIGSIRSDIDEVMQLIEESRLRLVVLVRPDDKRAKEALDRITDPPKDKWNTMGNIGWTCAAVSGALSGALNGRVMDAMGLATVHNAFPSNPGIPIVTEVLTAAGVIAGSVPVLRTLWNRHTRNKRKHELELQYTDATASKG